MLVNLFVLNVVTFLQVMCEDVTIPDKIQAYDIAPSKI